MLLVIFVLFVKTSVFIVFIAILVFAHWAKILLASLLAAQLKRRSWP